MSLLEVLFNQRNNTFGPFRPPMNWKETPDSHVIEIDLPGFRKEDVKLQILEGRIVHVSGERKEEEEGGKWRWHCRERSSAGSFSRQFHVPRNAKADEMKASMRDGVLVVMLPKMNEVKKTKKMEIEISGSGDQETQLSSKGLGRFLCCKA